MLKVHLVLLLCLQLAFAPVAWAADSAFLEYLEQNTGPSYFTIKEFPNQKLIPVRLIGGVARPGFYQVPEGTSLVSLISYSGGVNQGSDLESVKVWHHEKKVEERVDVERLMRGKSLVEPVVGANDIVYVDPKQTLFSQNTLTTLAVLSSVAAIILSTYLIDDRINNRK